MNNKEQRLKSIQTGAYWFERAGKIAVCFGGVFSILSGIIAVIIASSVNSFNIKVVAEILLMFGQAGVTLFFGWVFFKARDAFEAIEYLINETDGVI